MGSAACDRAHRRHRYFKAQGSLTLQYFTNLFAGRFVFDMTTFLLFESASGYGLFEATKFDEIGNSVDEMQQSIIDVSRFGKNVKLIAFKPFTSAANALEQINAVSESQVMHARIHLPSDSSVYRSGRYFGCLK